MIQVLTIAFQRYMSVPFEDYKEKLISALGLFELDDSISEEEKKKVYDIEKNTHEKIKVNFYVLERYLINKKQEINHTDNIIQVKNHEGKWLKLREITIGKYLSIAIRRVNQYTLKHFKDYMIEQKMNYQTDTSKNDDYMELFR